MRPFRILIPAFVTVTFVFLATGALAQGPTVTMTNPTGGGDFLFGDTVNVTATIEEGGFDLDPNQVVLFTNGDGNFAMNLIDEGAGNWTAWHPWNVSDPSGLRDIEVVAFDVDGNGDQDEATVSVNHLTSPSGQATDAEWVDLADVSVELDDRPSVWVRDRGGGTTNRVIKMDDDLNVEVDREVCTGLDGFSGFEPVNAQRGLTATPLGFALLVCGLADSSDWGVVVLNRDGTAGLDGLEHNARGLDQGSSPALDARGLQGGAVWANGQQGETGLATWVNFADGVTVVRDEFFSVVPSMGISKHPELDHVVFSLGDEGAVVRERVGEAVVPFSPVAAGTAAEIHGRIVFVHDALGDEEVKRFDTRAGAFEQTHATAFPAADAGGELLDSAITLSAGGDVVAFLKDDEVTLHDAGNLEQIVTLDAPEALRAVDVSPDLDHVWGVGEDTVYRWDVQNMVGSAGVTSSFQDLSDEDPGFVTDPFGPGEGGLFGDGILTQIGDGFGLALPGARLFIGGIVIAFGGLFGHDRAGKKGALVGGAGATVVAMVGGLIPLYVVAGIAIITLGVFLGVRR